MPHESPAAPSPPLDGSGPAAARDVEARVRAHYGAGASPAAVLAALAAAGHDPADLPVPALWPLDQFHSRGIDATRELAALADVAPDDRVLDVGGGIGGAARLLAGTVGCRVAVLDLSEPFCALGAALTARTAVAPRVAFATGSALALPVADASVDLAWSQHAAMNVPDAPRLYAELHRVLRPGGRLALHDVVAAPGAPALHFPVPWAAEPAASHLREADAVRRAITDAGFGIRHWHDVTDATTAWARDRLAAAQAGPPPALGLHLLLGAGFGAALASLLRNLEEERVRVVMALAVRS